MDLRLQVIKLLNLIKNKLAAVIQKAPVPIKSDILGLPKGFYKLTSDFFATSSLSRKCHYMKIFVQDDYGHKIYSILPKSIDKNIYWKFSKVHNNFINKNTIKNIFPEPFVAIIHDGRVFGNSGAVIAPDDQLLADVSFEFAGRIGANHPVFSNLKLPCIYKINSTVAVLSVAGGVGYYHWMFDLLPRIELLRRSELDIL